LGLNLHSRILIWPWRAHEMAVRMDFVFDHSTRNKEFLVTLFFEFDRIVVFSAFWRFKNVLNDVNVYRTRCKY
jgi:hypothetical protein